MQQVTNQLVNNAKTQGVKISGPVRVPNKHLRICCRRTPCGEGSKTWDQWEMTIYKRYIDLECTASQIKEVTSITIPNGIEISVDFRAAWLSIFIIIILFWNHYIDSTRSIFDRLNKWVPRRRERRRKSKSRSWRLNRKPMKRRRLSTNSGSGPWFSFSGNINFHSTMHMLAHKELNISVLMISKSFSKTNLNKFRQTRI